MPDKKSPEPWFERPSDYRTHHWRSRSNAVRRRETALTDWYGANDAALEIEARQQPEKHIRELVDDVLATLDNGDRLLFRKILDRWPQLVGPEVHYNTRPQRLTSGVLYLEVFSAAWRFNVENQLMPELVAIVKNASGGRIHRIQCVPGGRTPRRS